MARRKTTGPQTIEEIDAAIQNLQKQRAAKMKALREEKARQEKLRQTLLGRALIERARQGDVPAKSLVNQLQSEMAGADAKPFAGWRHDRPA